MLRPEFASLAAPAPAQPERIASPVLPGVGRGFSALLHDVSGEVTEFIEYGSPDLGLSASGQAWRMRARAPAQLPEDAAPSTAAAVRMLGLDPVDRADRPTGSRATAAGIGAPTGDAKRDAFLAAIAPWANEAASRLGVAPELVAAQAALESGWGQRPVRGGDGADSHNLFGIKAGAQWRGAVAEAVTTEFDDGGAARRSERFRSYPDHGSAFRDFTQLLLDNPRYRDALGAGDDAVAYAEALARGGYATDPDYADKLARIAASLQRGK
ncbi:glucosaminidase domain-containing protein [Aromatoleum sp.]|uniref:glucosaminidase domain-containing protein n=1 Tax=Aromatoleum sp. TaxID=2307007 RepID=UPI002FC8AE44